MFFKSNCHRSTINMEYYHRNSIRSTSNNCIHSVCLISLDTIDINTKLPIAIDNLLMIKMCCTSAIVVFSEYERRNKTRVKTRVKVHVWLKSSFLTTCFLEAWLHVNICFICVKSAELRTLPGQSLYTPAGCRTVPGRASAGVIMYRRRPAPVRFVTTQRQHV